MGTTKERAVSDELDSADAAASGPVTPWRPTGKRARQRTAGASAGEVTAGAVDVDERDDADTAVIAVKTPKKPSAKGGSRNPITIIVTYLRQVVAELRKVIWPNRKQMVTYTSVVLVFLAFMVALIGVVDLGLAKLVLLVFG
jgi:preprotein translocase subunit SecE